MLNKFFGSAFRHLWRHRLFTILNILGLALSISTCWIIYRIVSYEFSYDSKLPNKENIYRVVSGFKFDEKNESYNGGASKPLYQGIRSEVSGLKYAVPVFGQWVNAVEVNSTNSKPAIIEEPENIVATDSTYFAMLPYQWLAGSRATALKAPESIVLTASRAKIYFPDIAPEMIINRSLTYYSNKDTIQRTVTGVVADIVGPTEFISQEFVMLPTKAYELSQWTNTNGSDKLYLQFTNGTKPDYVLKEITKIAVAKMKEFDAQSTNDFKLNRWFQLMPLSESHFSININEEVRKASKPVLYGLAGIAIFLLILACINYVNMSVAQIPQRAKEIGVRKTLGSNRTQLITRFLSETILTTLVAIIFAFFLCKIGFFILGDIIPKEITPFGNGLQMAVFAVGLLLIVTLLAGLYPGWLITKVKTINVFRNNTFNENGTKKFNLQKALTVFQFVIALVFITSALIVGNQLQYVLKSDMGFNKDAVVLVSVPWKYSRKIEYKDKQFVLLNELKKIPGIRKISLGNEPMSINYNSSEYQYSVEGKEAIKLNVYRKAVDTGYINLYGMKLLAGRNLSVSDTTNEFVLNETAVRAFGFKLPEDALGKMIGQETEKFPVVGVVADFHAQDFYKAIQPLALMSEKDNLNTLNIKLDSRFAAQWQPALKAIEKKWYQFYPPESFEYKFYDETLKGIYEQERNLATLINIATFIAIFISCLGLFGLVTLTAFQRTKEIGIRKVLGASVSGIVQLLSKEYLLIVIVAIVIAIPIAWWAMNKWLEKFAYRIEIKWWMFVIAGLAALTIAMITISFQAIKAGLANPVKSLRTE